MESGASPGLELPAFFRRPGRLLSLSAFALSFAYLLFLALLPVRTIWINDEGNKLAACLALSFKGSCALPDPAAELDPSLNSYPPPFFVKGADGLPRSGYSPLFPALCAPAVKFGGLWGARLVPLFAGLLCAFLVARALAAFGAAEPWQALGLLLCGLGTPLLFYSFAFLEISLASALWAFSLLFLLRAPSGGESRGLFLRFALAGVLAGFATAFREEGYLCLAAFAISLPFCGRSLRDVFFYSAGAALALLPLWLWNLHESGSIFGLHAKLYASLYGVQTLQSQIAEVPAKLWHFLIKAHFDSIIPLALFSALLPISAAIGAFGGLRLKTLALALCVAVAVGNCAAQFLSVEAMEGTLRHQSFAESFPFLALPLIFLRELWTDLRFRLLLLSSFLATLGIALLLNMASIGIFWGARHFLLLAPQLCIVAPENWTAA